MGDMQVGDAGAQAQRFRSIGLLQLKGVHLLGVWASLMPSGCYPALSLDLDTQ